MANDPQSSGANAWEDNSLVDASKLHQQVKGSFSGPNVNNSTYLLKDEVTHWDKDDYHFLFKDRKTKDFTCESNNSKLQGFGPWCEFQDIGRGQEHQCIFEERRKCIATYVDALQAFPPRGPWNNLNTQSEQNAGKPYPARRFPLDSIAATQSREEWQRTGEPPMEAYPCVPYLVDMTRGLCDRGKSGLVSIKAVQKALNKCLAAVDKKCQCTNCEELPDEDETYEWKDDDDKPDNPTDDQTDDDGEPAPGVDRQTTTVSSYDMPIPITFGRISVKGNIIWIGTTTTEEVTYTEPLNPDTQTAPETITKTVLLGSIAIGLCKGEIAGISKITFGNRVVFRGALPEDFDPYDVEVENSKAIFGQLEGIVETTRRVDFKVYQGEAAAKINPEMAAVNGGRFTPAYRGLAYLLIHNVPISEFARDGLPNVTVEVYTRTKANARPIMTSTPIDGSAFAKFDPEFLSLNVVSDRLYASGGNTGLLTHGVRMLNFRNLVEVKQQAAVDAIPASMMLSRDNIVVYQEKDINRTRTHWYSADYDTIIKSVGANEAGNGHEISPGSLGAWSRTYRGAPGNTFVSFQAQFSSLRPGTSLEYYMFPSRFDDLARFEHFHDTQIVQEISGERVSGYPDEEPSLCLSTCLTGYATYCYDYCVYVANTGGSSGDCTIEPPNIWITDGIVYDSSTETVVGTLDHIDGSGNIFVVGSETPVAVQDCTGYIPPGDPLPPDPMCIADCTLSAEAYCEAFCGSGTRIIETVFEGVRPTISGDGLATPQTERGAMIAYRPFSSAPYSNMTSLVIEWLQIGSTETNMLMNLSFFPEAYQTLTMDLWGNNASSILAQVIAIPGGEEHVFFIKTLSGPDYAFRYRHYTNEVVWQLTLPSRLPTYYSSGDRKVEYPNTEYIYIGATGDIVRMDLFDGTAEITGNISTYSFPAVTGAQLYDPRDRSVTYIANTEIAKVYPTRDVIDDVSLAEIAAGVFDLCGINARDYDVSALEDTRVIGYIIEDFGDAKTFLTQIKELFGLYASDIAPINFAPPGVGGTEWVSAYDARYSIESEVVETRKWQDRQFDEVTIRSLNPSFYAEVATATATVDDSESAYGGIKQFDTKFAFYRGQAESLAELFLMNNKLTRGEIVITLGPEYARLEPGDVFTYIDRSDETRDYVITSTNHMSLPNTLVAETIESLSPLSFAGSQPVMRQLKPLRQPAVIFTNAVNDVDARALIAGNQVVYAGIMSPQENFAARSIYALGGRRETDNSSSSFSRSSSIEFPPVGKALHSGVGPVLPRVRSWWMCDRKSTIDVTFDRDSTIDLMSNATEIEVINDSTRNLLIYDGEQIQFLNVTRIAPRVARFSGLYRGRNGTEVVKDLVRDRDVRVYYYTPDTFVSAVVPNDTYAAHPQVEARVADTAVGRQQAIPAIYRSNDYASRLWAPDQITATRLSTAAYTDVSFSWKPRTPLTERENTEFTPYLAEERYIVYIWSSWFQGEIPIDEFDSAVYLNDPGNSIRYRTPVVVGQRSVTIRENIWRLIGFNPTSNRLYVIVAQIHPVTGQIGLPGCMIVPN